MVLGRPGGCLAVGRARRGVFWGGCQRMGPAQHVSRGWAMYPASVRPGMGDSPPGPGGVFARVPRRRVGGMRALAGHPCKTLGAAGCLVVGGVFCPPGRKANIINDIRQPAMLSCGGHGCGPAADGGLGPTGIWHLSGWRVVLVGGSGWWRVRFIRAITKSLMSWMVDTGLPHQAHVRVVLADAFMPVAAAMQYDCIWPHGPPSPHL